MIPGRWGGSMSSTVGWTVSWTVGFSERLLRRCFRRMIGCLIYNCRVNGVEEFGLKSFGVGILWLRYPQSFTLTIMERHDIRRGCQTFARFHGGDEMWSVGKDQTARNIASAEMNYEGSIVSNDERANT